MNDYSRIALICGSGVVSIAAICFWWVYVMPKLRVFWKRASTRTSLTTSRLESLGLYDEAEALDTLTESLEQRGLYQEAQELRKQADQLADEQEGAIAEMELGDW